MHHMINQLIKHESKTSRINTEFIILMLLISGPRFKLSASPRRRGLISLASNCCWQRRDCGCLDPPFAAGSFAPGAATAAVWILRLLACGSLCAASFAAGSASALAPRPAADSASELAPIPATSQMRIAGRSIPGPPWTPPSHTSAECKRRESDLI